MFNDGSELTVYPELIVCIEGIESIYPLAGLNHEKRPIYRKKGSPNYLIQEDNGNFLWARQEERLIFNPKGTLLRVEDLYGQGITYEYDSGFLTKIVDDWGEAIFLTYRGDQVSLVEGPGGKFIQYEYFPNGLLQTVRDGEGILATYEYDEGKRLTTIYNGRSNKIFEATYDTHHRAIEQMNGESFVTHQFNLHDRTALVQASNNYSYEEQCDAQYRPEVIQDGLGRKVQLIYGQDEGPQKFITNSALEVDCEYDAQGNLSRIYDEFRGERRFVYNDQGKVIHEKDGGGIERAYLYDDKGHLTEMYDPFLLSTIEVFEEKTYVQGNASTLTSFEYDQDTGLLTTIIFPGGQRETYRYNEKGLPIEITLLDGISITKEYDEKARLKKLETKGKSLTYSYDERDRIKKVSSENSEVQFSYDAAGNLSRLTDPLNRTTCYEYDHFERLTQTIDPEKGMTFYEYSSSGISRVTLPNSSTREIFYDTYGRPTAIR